MRICTRCKCQKPLFEFQKKCDTADGVTSRCKACLSEVSKAAYTARKDAILAKNKAWYEANKVDVNQRRKINLDREAHKEKCRAYYKENKASIRVANDAWNAANPEVMRRVWREYAKRNTVNRNANSAERRAKKHNALAKWDTELTTLVTKEAAALCRLRAKTLGGKWHVDHVVPLRGKIVSGLHVWNNLQVLPAKANISKGNKFCEAM